MFIFRFTGWTTTMCSTLWSGTLGAWWDWEISRCWTHMVLYTHGIAHTWYCNMQGIVRTCMPFVIFLTKSFCVRGESWRSSQNGSIATTDSNGLTTLETRWRFKSSFANFEFISASDRLWSRMTRILIYLSRSPWRRWSRCWQSSSLKEKGSQTFCYENLFFINCLSWWSNHFYTARSLLLLLFSTSFKFLFNIYFLL